MEYLISEKQLYNLNEGLNNNVYRNRWHHERSALKNYLINYGQSMVSKENGKIYKVILDRSISDMLGMNYCICVQWDPMIGDAGEIVYVRAYDKFEPSVG